MRWVLRIKKPRNIKSYVTEFYQHTCLKNEGFWSLELPSQSHNYLRGIPEDAKNVLKERGSRSLMAMEYLTVCPDYRAEVIAGARAAEMIVRLGLKVMNSLGLDAAIGVARVDRKVNSLADSIGCEEIMLMEKYNNKCSLMYFDHRFHTAKGNPFVMNMVENLWKNRNQG